MSDWKPKTLEWDEYPIGTKAREKGFPGYWTKQREGWMWCTSYCISPHPTDANEVKVCEGFTDE
jgi:hypothetical protein